MGIDVRVVTGVPVAANFALGGGLTPNSPIIINDTTGTAYFLNSAGVVTSLGGGTVTHTVGNLTANALVVGNAAADIDVLASLGTTTTVLHGNAGGRPTFGAVSLTADISGTLAIGNGGTGNLTGTATTNANLTGPITSTGNATAVAAQTGTGSVFVMQATPTLTTPVIGAATGTSVTLTGVVSGGSAGGTLVATQANQETATSTTTLVSPGRQQFHPSACKGWVEIAADASITSSYNVTSITDNAAGDFTTNWTTAFSTANYCAVATSLSDSDNYARVTSTTTGAGATRTQNRSVASIPTGQDATQHMVAVFGDFA